MRQQNGRCTLSMTAGAHCRQLRYLILQIHTSGCSKHRHAPRPRACCIAAGMQPVWQTKAGATCVLSTPKGDAVQGAIWQQNSLKSSDLKPLAKAHSRWSLALLTHPAQQDQVMQTLGSVQQPVCSHKSILRYLLLVVPLYSICIDTSISVGRQTAEVVCMNAA